MTAHHINPRDWGGEDEVRNLITLCSSCHDAVEIITHEKGKPLSWEELTRPPIRGQDNVKRVWFVDKQGRVGALIV